MTLRYWVGVVGLGHVDFGVKTGICAFSHGKRAAIEKLSEGDRFVYYSPRTAYRDGDPVQKFVALGTVIDATPIEVNWNGYDLWAAKAAYAAVTPAPVRPLLGPLRFVTNPAKWGMAFRRGQFEITESDFGLIETALKSGDPL